MAKISFHDMLGVGDKASPDEIHAAFERACSALSAYSDTDERRNRLVFLQHARDSLLKSREPESNACGNQQVQNLAVPASGRGWQSWQMGIAGLVAGYLLAWWFARPPVTLVMPTSSTASIRELPQVPSESNDRPRTPQNVDVQMVDVAAPRMDPHPALSTASLNKSDVRFSRLREMAASKATMFDIREEAYRIANTGGVRLLDIQFDADGRRAASVAWALPTLEGNSRYCSIRVARSHGQERLRAGESITELESTLYKAVLAHELSHCVDWHETGFKGWTAYAKGLKLRPGLTPADMAGRWREEFADLYAIYLLRLSYGEGVAKDASQILAFERRHSGDPAYKHSWIPMERGNPLGISSSADAHAIISRYWMQ